MTNINIKLNLSTESVTGKDIVNAVRRALANVETVSTEEVTEVKGVRVLATPEPEKGFAEKVRTWARENGHEVGQRGRVSAELVEKYTAAN